MPERVDRNPSNSAPRRLGGCIEALLAAGRAESKSAAEIVAAHLCCSSCHEDEDQGFADLAEWWPSGDLVYYGVCCAVLREVNPNV